MKGRYVIKKSRKFIVSLIIAVFLVGIFPTNISTVTAIDKPLNKLNATLRASLCRKR